VKRLTALWSCVANELAARCSTSATRDIKTVTSRIEHEGLAFLAITLADLGKATQKWLDLGLVFHQTVPLLEAIGLEGSPYFYEVSSNVCSIHVAVHFWSAPTSKQSMLYVS